MSVALRMTSNKQNWFSQIFCHTKAVAMERNVISRSVEGTNQPGVQQNHDDPTTGPTTQDRCQSQLLGNSES
eukprot:5270856-Amphidinium_carterae.1